MAFALAIEDQFSPACLNDDRCTRGEELAMSALGLSWVVALVVAIILGWRGHLPGARKARTEP